MQLTKLIEELEHLYQDRGDCAVEIPDPIEAQWRNPVDRVEFDEERQAVLLVSDR